MNAHPLSIEKITRNRLREFARRSLTDSRFSDVSPISLIRAGGQSKNPHAGPDDICLVVGYENNRCIGYHGLLPGYLRHPDGLSSVYWLVTFFVKPECRGKGYGKRLVQEIQGTGVDLVTTGITDAAESVYRNAGFQTLGELVYYRIRTDSPALKKSLLERPGHWHGLKETRRVQETRELQVMGTPVGGQPGQRPSAPAFERDIDMQNWMLQHPWIVSRDKAKSDVNNYYFSRVRDHFAFKGIVFYAPDEKHPRGHMTLSFSSRKDKTVVKILDVAFQEPADSDIAAYTGLQYAVRYRAQHLEFPDSLCRSFRQQPALDGFIQKKKRLYLFWPQNSGSPLARNAAAIKLNYCDGDMAFT
jgi:GNAT superfamily N-acetyltransferase